MPGRSRSRRRSRRKKSKRRSRRRSRIRKSRRRRRSRRSRTRTRSKRRNTTSAVKNPKYVGVKCGFDPPSDEELQYLFNKKPKVVKASHGAEVKKFPFPVYRYNPSSYSLEDELNFKNPKPVRVPYFTKKQIIKFCGARRGDCKKGTFTYTRKNNKTRTKYISKGCLLYTRSTGTGIMWGEKGSKKVLNI